MNIQEDGVGTPSGSDIEAMKAQIASLELEKNNLVGELKEDRKKRQELQTQITTLQDLVTDTVKNKQTLNPNGDMLVLVEEALAKALSAKDASNAKKNKEAAFEKFVSKHKEFHPENDTTGKLREALENEFNTFNTANIVEEKDFEAMILKAHKLIGGNTTPETSAERVITPYANTPIASVTPKTVLVNDMSDAELKLCEQTGWTRERYLKLKAKMPESYIRNLLSHVR